MVMTAISLSFVVLAARFSPIDCRYRDPSGKPPVNLHEGTRLPAEFAQA